MHARTSIIGLSCWSKTCAYLFRKSQTCRQMLMPLEVSIHPNCVFYDILSPPLFFVRWQERKIQSFTLFAMHSWCDFKAQNGWRKDAWRLSMDATVWLILWHWRAAESVCGIRSQLNNPTTSWQAIVFTVSQVSRSMLPSDWKLMSMNVSLTHKWMSQKTEQVFRTLEPNKDVSGSIQVARTAVPLPLSSTVMSVAECSRVLL